MFKKGDIIKRIEDPYNNLPIGTICVVKECIGNHSISIEGDNRNYLNSHRYFELVFPANWCIKGCEELADWQKNVMFNKCDCYLDEDFYYTLRPNTDNLKWDFTSFIKSEYKEITFEDFQKYVLKIDRKPFKLKRK